MSAEVATLRHRWFETGWEGQLFSRVESRTFSRVETGYGVGRDVLVIRFGWTPNHEPHTGTVTGIAECSEGGFKRMCQYEYSEDKRYYDTDGTTEIGYSTYSRTDTMQWWTGAITLGTPTSSSDGTTTVYTNVMISDTVTITTNTDTSVSLTEVSEAGYDDGNTVTRLYRETITKTWSDGKMPSDYRAMALSIYANAGDGGGVWIAGPSGWIRTEDTDGALDPPQPDDPLPAPGLGATPYTVDLGYSNSDDVAWADIVGETHSVRGQDAGVGTPGMLFPINDSTWELEKYTFDLVNGAAFDSATAQQIHTVPEEQACFLSELGSIDGVGYVLDLTP